MTDEPEKVILQYFDGNDWISIGEWISPKAAWISLGDDNIGYRIIDKNKNIIISNLKNKYNDQRRTKKI